MTCKRAVKERRYSCQFDSLPYSVLQWDCDGMVAASSFLKISCNYQASRSPILASRMARLLLSKYRRLGTNINREKGLITAGLCVSVANSWNLFRKGEKHVDEPNLG